MTRFIKHPNGRRGPRLSDWFWIRKQIRKVPKGEKIRFTFTPTTDTLYTVENRGGDNDQNDWLKLGGTAPWWGAIAHKGYPWCKWCLKYDRETLGGWRLLQDDWYHNTFEGAIYKRSEESGGKHEATLVDAYILDPWNGVSNSSLTIEIPREFSFALGAWLGGDGKIIPSNGKFVGYYLNIEKV